MTTAWPKHIEQYREYSSWECKDLPVDLVLAVIEHESGGIAGDQAKVKCKAAILPTVGGGKINVNRALGLMQVIPPNIAAWNEQGGEQVFFEDMTGSDERAIRLQIRLGCWILASSFRGLNKFFPAVFPTASGGEADPNQVQCALVGYAVGVGALREKFDALKAEGKPLTYAQLRVSFPNWGKSKKTGKWINRPLHYAEVVWNEYAKHIGGKKIDTKPPGLKDKVVKAWASGGWLLIPVAAAALWAMSKGKVDL
jgi:hypothetical protein